MPYDPSAIIGMEDQRRRAEALRKGVSPMGGQMVSGIYVADSPIKGMANLLREYGANKMETEATQKERELVLERQKALAEALGGGDAAAAYGIDPNAANFIQNQQMNQWKMNQADADKTLRQQELEARRKDRLAEREFKSKESALDRSAALERARVISQQKQAAADVKSKEKKEKEVKGKEGLQSILTEMKSNYDKLKEKGGITSTEQSGLENIAASTSASGAGQLLGGVVGAEEQKLRDSIVSARPLLMQAIKSATGMTAQQMNSDKDMQMMLQAATDPSLGYETNIETIKRLDRLYGLGGISEDMGGESQGMPRVGDIQSGYRFKGGDPSNPSSWEKI